MYNYMNTHPHTHTHIHTHTHTHTHTHISNILLHEYVYHVNMINIASIA